MARYSCIIIEDEPLALERTRLYVERVPFLHLNATFDNALDGMSYLQANQVDLLFLDIKMDELTGVELLESISLDAEVIITTAYQEYALKGYELRVTDYLLKPFTFKRFLQAVNAAKSNLQRSGPSPTRDFLFIKTENRLEKVLIEDILYIEGMRDYRRVHTPDKRIMTLERFSDLEANLPAERVCRVHKSFMVGVKNIQSIERSRIRVGNRLIPISETYRSQFFNLIK